MGDVAMPTSSDSARLDDHERRITNTEARLSDVERSQIKAEVRWEQLGRDMDEIKGNMSAVRGGMDFFRFVFKWGAWAAGGLIGLMALYGDRLLHLWQDLHHS